MTLLQIITITPEEIYIKIITMSVKTNRLDIAKFNSGARRPQTY